MMKLNINMEKIITAYRSARTIERYDSILGKRGFGIFDKRLAYMELMKKLIEFDKEN